MPVIREPISYRTWGTDIDTGAHEQMRAACQVPNAVGAALMPDAHIGYGLPIGGVLACENAVIPYAVGVDIACRMKLSVLDLPVESLTKDFNRYKEALNGGTRFGVGVEHRPAQSHAVMDHDWNVTRITRERKDTAWRQLGTSGSGNHFVEFGVLSLAHDDKQLGLEAGEYVALLSHSGSRGAGAAVCSTYSQIAQAALPRRYKDLGRLAWLDLDSEAGQEYWAGDEPDGRVRRGEPRGDPPAGHEAARRRDHRRRREPSQLRVERAAPGPRADRPSQRRDAGRRRACWA